MKLVGEEMRKYEYILDVFKGTCELNNCEAMKVPVYGEDGSPCVEIVKEALMMKPSDSKKVYFYGPILDGKESIVFGALCDNVSSYSIAEMVNMAVKFLTNLDMEDITVDISSEDVGILQDNLETLNIPVEAMDDEETSFTVYVDDEPIMYGGLADEKIVYMFGDYGVLQEKIDYKDTKTPLDVYVSPSQKEVLDDAFIIGSDLKDAGFKVEVDYSLKQVTKDDIDATFLVTFDKDDIAKYEVKLIDMATREIKRVKIDGIIEEIMFI